MLKNSPKALIYLWSLWWTGYVDIALLLLLIQTYPHVKQEGLLQDPSDGQKLISQFWSADYVSSKYSLLPMHARKKL